MRKKGVDMQPIIRKAAMELFSECGYEHVTIKDICDRAGCTPGTFYYHYGSMKRFILEIYEVENQFDTDFLLRILSYPSAWEKLWAIHQTYVKQALSFGPHAYFQIFLSSEEESKERHLFNFDKITQLIAPFVKEGQLSGEIRNQMPYEQLSTSVGIMMMGVLCKWRLSSDDYDLEAEMKKMLTTLYEIELKEEIST